MEYVPMPNTLGFIMQRVCFFNVFFFYVEAWWLWCLGPRKISKLSCSYCKPQKDRPVIYSDLLIWNFTFPDLFRGCYRPTERLYGAYLTVTSLECWLWFGRVKCQLTCICESCLPKRRGQWWFHSCVKNELIVCFMYLQNWLSVLQNWLQIFGNHIYLMGKFTCSCAKKMAEITAQFFPGKRRQQGQTQHSSKSKWYCGWKKSCSSWQIRCKKSNLNPIGIPVFHSYR